MPSVPGDPAMKKNISGWLCGNLHIQGTASVWGEIHIYVYAGSFRLVIKRTKLKFFTASSSLYEYLYTLLNKNADIQQLLPG